MTEPEWFEPGENKTAYTNGFLAGRVYERQHIIQRLLDQDIIRPSLIGSGYVAMQTDGEEAVDVAGLFL